MLAGMRPLGSLGWSPPRRSRGWRGWTSKSTRLLLKPPMPCQCDCPVSASSLYSPIRSVAPICTAAPERSVLDARSISQPAKRRLVLCHVFPAKAGIQALSASVPEGSPSTPLLRKLTGVGKFLSRRRPAHPRHSGETRNPRVGPAPFGLAGPTNLHVGVVRIELGWNSGFRPAPE